MLKCIGYHFIWDRTAEKHSCTHYYGFDRFKFQRKVSAGVYSSGESEIGSLLTIAHEKDEVRRENYQDGDEMKVITFDCSRGG